MSLKHKSKSVDDISLAYIWIFLIASICMTHYGLNIKSYPVVFNNITSTVINIIMLYLYYTHTL